MAEELMAKNELIEEANNFIIEYQDEKHQLKAKFKVIVGLIQSDQTISSYKSSDEIDIDDCFEIIEEAILDQSQSKIHNNPAMNQNKAEYDLEIRQRQ